MIVGRGRAPLWYRPPSAVGERATDDARRLVGQGGGAAVVAERSTGASAGARAGLSGRLEAGLVGLIGLGCLASRLYQLDRYSGSYPEGIRAEQLLLMAAGFRPFQDIFSNQGPWALQILYPGYLLFGGTLVGVRAVVVLASLVGLAACWWIARRLAGPAGGLAVLLLLAVSPSYLQFSRLSLAEVVALAPAALAVGCGLRFGEVGRDRWALGAGLLLAVSWLVKPITVGSAVPVGLAILLGGGRRWRGLLLSGAACLGTLLSGVALVGWTEVMSQIVQYRAASRGAEGWSLATNLARFRAELGPEGPPLLGLAGLGLVLAIARPKAWAPVGWALAGGLTVLAHAPLHSKHFVIVVVPLAVLAAYAVGRLAELPGGGRRLGRLGLGLVGLAWLALLPGQLRHDWQILTADDLFERDGARPWYGEAIETLGRVSRPGEFVLSDHTYLAWAADRPVPPGLVEASATRVKAGSLTDALAIDQTRRYDTRAVLLWADKLIDLKRYRAWLTEEYAPVKVWAAEGDTRPVLWLRNDERLAADRAALRVGSRPAPPEAVYGSWRLVGLGLVEPPVGASGGPVSVRLEVEAIGEPGQEARVLLTLRDGTGRVVDSEQEPLLGGLGRPRWLFWVGAVQVPKAAAGEYRVEAALADQRGRALGPAVEVGRVRVGGS